MTVEYFRSEGLLFAIREDVPWVWRDADWEPVEPGSHLAGRLQRLAADPATERLEHPPRLVPEPPEGRAGWVIPLVLSPAVAGEVGSGATVWLVLSEHAADGIRSVEFEGAFRTRADADAFAARVHGDVHHRRVVLRAAGERIELVDSNREPFDVWTLRQIVRFLERVRSGVG